ncbi:Solitary outer membrane autotransporter beta-barrel domain [Vibrio lentus]|nr:Solitary outer membrane autotransporter beta-barrel domain [Vibrio lentus]
MNTSAWALIGEPSVEIYAVFKADNWGSWNVSSRAPLFLLGQNWGEANDGIIGNPEGFRFINEIEFRQNVKLESLSLITHGFVITSDESISRVISRRSFDTHYYYEFGAGLVFDVPLRFLLL